MDQGQLQLPLPAGPYHGVSRVRQRVRHPVGESRDRRHIFGRQPSWHSRRRDPRHSHQRPTAVRDTVGGSVAAGRYGHGASGHTALRRSRGWPYHILGTGQSCAEEGHSRLWDIHLGSGSSRWTRSYSSQRSPTHGRGRSECVGLSSHGIRNAGGRRSGARGAQLRYQQRPKGQRKHRRVWVEECSASCGRRPTRPSHERSGNCRRDALHQRLPERSEELQRVDGRGNELSSGRGSFRLRLRRRLRLLHHRRGGNT